MLKKITLIATTAMLLMSCEKDPVNVSPTDAYSTNNYPQSISDLESILVPAYSNLRDQYLYGFSFLSKAVSNSTHAVNAIYSGDQAWNEMANTNLNTGNTYSSGVWQALFTGVKNTNVVLNAAEFYQENYLDPNDTQAQERLEQIMGQAYFLRAYYYFQLESLFGEGYITAENSGEDMLGMPIYDEVPDGLEETQKARSSVKETWDFIKSDLKKAAELLEGTTWTGNNKGRVTEWAAKGLLGKAYVFTEEWQKAQAVLEDVIQNSGKSLMPCEKYRNAFIGIPENEFNEESLFEINVDPDPNGGYGIFSAAPNTAAIQGLIWAPKVLGANGTVDAGYHLGYGNEFFHDKNVLRYGYPLDSSYELVPNPDYDPEIGPRYDNPELIMDPEYKEAALAVRENQTADPRLYVNAVQPWLDSLRFDGENWAPAIKVYPGNQAEYMFGMRKYSPILYNENVGLDGAGASDAWNYYLLRLADIYLLYAEANMETGDAATALEYINKVRRRAYCYPTNAPSPVDYTSLSDETPAAAAGDPVLGNNPLYYERWAELFNEGHWWFDVGRWRLGESEAAFYETAYNVSGPFQFDPSKSYVWPIPLTEINSNSEIIQNPGY